MAELQRAASPKGTALIIGRVARAEHSVQSQMRQQMRQLLKKFNIEPRDGKKRSTSVFNYICRRCGGRVSEPLEVAKWKTTHTPKHSITSWENNAGLAGNDITPELKTQILQELKHWAADHFGNLETEIESTETYILESVFFK